MTTDPQSDPIERAKRCFSDSRLEKLTPGAEALVVEAIQLYDKWLGLKGVPVGKLLSGEMVAVPVQPLHDVACGGCERMIPGDAAACPYCHTIFAEQEP